MKREKGLTNLQVINGKWRGIMPSRHCKAGRELLEQYRRTGEPSLAIQYLNLGMDERGGWGKAKGSYTELLRNSFFEWLEAKNGGWASPLTFEYRLSRKKYITVVGTYPYILHNPTYGDGKKGFVLKLQVISIDGLPYRGIGRLAWFAWDRIVGKERMLALPIGSPQIKPVEAKE